MNNAMPQEQSPHSDNEAAAEMLRLVLPLLNKHNIPPTPANYALWYEYTTGENISLKQEMDQLLAKGVAFTAALNEDLHRRHIQDCRTTETQKIRNRITGILGDLLESLAQMGADTGSYEHFLEQQIGEVRRCSGLQDLEGLLSVLAEESKVMRHSTQTLKLEFEQKSHDIQALKTELEQVKKTASSDPLTGLPNRRALLDSLDKLEAAYGSCGHSLLMMDIDNFKAFNDTHGHLTGDRVLRFVANVIRQQIKGQDVPARFGGEEFAILLPETPLAGAMAVAESIRKNLAAAKLVRSGTQQSLGRITVSVGAAACRRGEDSIELIERADQALYLAKEQGRNQVVSESEL